MDKHNWTVSDLLARRDGKPLDVARARAIANDATAQRDLHRLVALQSELNALPDVAVDDAVWRTAIADASATDLHRVGFGLRYPVATAASVFVATAMFIVYVPSGTNQVEIQPAAADIQIDEAARKLAELHKHKFSVRAREGSAKLGIMLGNISRGNISRHVPLLAQEGLAQEPGTSESRNGVELYGVTPGGGAEAAGLQAGDLITSIGATSLVDVDEPMQALVSHMKGVELGEEVMVNYLREGVSASAAITTQERSAHMATFFSDSDFDLDFDFDFDVNLDEFANGADFSAMIPSVRSSVEHSSRLMSVEGELAGYFAVDKGVLVVSAPQQDSQLKGGDIILSVGGEEIADVQQAQRHLAAIVNVADVDVMRSGQRHTISVAAGGGSMRTRSTRSESNAG